MKVTIKLPSHLDAKSFDPLIYLASKMYEDGVLTAGQAAELAGLSKRAFIEILGKYSVSLFSSSIEVLKKDIKNA